MTRFFLSAAAVDNAYFLMQDVYRLAAGALAVRQWVERVFTLLPIQHVADPVGFHWYTVKTIDNQRLQPDRPAPYPTRLLRFSR